VQFITSLFGGEGNSLFTALFALGIVVVLIVLAVWLLKLVFNASGNIARGRNRRLSVVDSLALDPKRQLLIIRRDNIEHLILTGGPQDVVVETGIPVEDAPAQATRRPLPVAAPRRPVPARPAAAPTPELEVKPTTAMERLRDLKPANLVATPRSLRQTGLMRAAPPVEAPVHRAENSTQMDHDSAKQVEGHSGAESTEFDEHGTDTGRDARKADGL
jgi:flagellar biogenesis protein FliO